MKVLDLFCCSGGATEGALNIGAHVTGLDIRKPTSYPGQNFIRKDIRDVTPEFLKRYDFVMSSPVCHQYSRSTAPARAKGKVYQDYIDLTRQLIIAAKIPGYIENVPSAPIANHLTLCGSMFDIKVIRHRRFELINWSTFFVEHDCTEICRSRMFTPMCGKYIRIDEVKRSMGLSWLRRTEWELNQAIPPCYSEYILNRYLNLLTAAKLHSELLNLTVYRNRFVKQNLYLPHTSSTAFYHRNMVKM